MATITRRMDKDLNRTIDIFAGGRLFAFFKEVPIDSIELREFIVVKEVDNTTVYVSDPGIFDTTGYSFNRVVGPIVNTINRNDGGSFVTEGYTVGQKVSVLGANIESNDGIYDVATVTASQLVVTAIGGGDAGLTPDTLDTNAALHPSGNVNQDWDEWVRVNAEGDFILGDPMTDAQVKDFNLSVWWTWILRRQMVQLLTNVLAAGWTPNERRKGTGGALAAAGVPLTQAQTIGDATTTAAQIAVVKHIDLGLADIPSFWKPLVRAEAD